MKRRTQTLLYHLLPVAFWLLAIGVSVLPLGLLPHRVDMDADGSYSVLWGYLVPPVCLLSALIIRRIPRHASSIEQCFQVAILLGIASYWLPSVLFLIIPVWIYLISRNIFSVRSFLSTLLGLALVAVWAAVFIFVGWIANPWADFFAIKSLWVWIPTGALLFAYIASTIVRQSLRVR